MAVSLFVAGDVVPRMGQHEAFKKSSKVIFGEIKPYIIGSDLSIANLEAPVVYDKLTPIKKSGPNLYTSSSTVEALKEVGFGVVTLANNHFFDQGQQGVENTLNECRNYGIDYVGGGKDKDDARRILFKSINDKSIAIINACEHEFSIADSSHGGSNPLDLIQMQEDVTFAKKEADYVIVIIHGGVELFHYPTPRMKRWYRHFVNIGADAVINHHQHCINGYEVYNGKPIFYGLGNFYFPQREGTPKYDSWACGYAVMLKLSEHIDFEMIPYEQDINGIKLIDKSIFKNKIEALSSPIVEDNTLLQKFNEYVISNENSLKLQLLPSFMRKRFFSGLVKRGYLGSLYQGRVLFDLKNKLTCDSHIEKLQRLFEILTKN